MSLLTSNTQVLKEAYFGGSKHLKEAEKHIADLIEIAKNSDSKYQLSKCPTNKKLEDALAKQFGLKLVNIHWMRNPSANLYTRPYIAQFSGIGEYINKKNYNLTKTFKNADKKIYISSTDSFLTDVGLTPDEILAALLHEIGHNFDTTTLRMVMGLPSLWCATIFSRAGRRADIISDNIVRKFSDFFDPLMDFFHLFNKEMNFLEPISRIINMITPKKTPSNPTYPKLRRKMLFNQFLHSFAGYGSERFSDSFAASYGYGVSLNRGLIKLEKFYKEDTMYGVFVNNIPVLDCLYSYALIFNNIVVSIMAVHPDNGIRLKSTINKLKRDLNDPSISKEMKKVIEDDLDTLESLYDDYLEVKDLPEFKTSVLTAYRKMNDKLFGGKFNIHEILNKEYERSEV